MKFPIDEDIIYAFARMIDDSQSEKRSPSHSEIQFHIQNSSLVDFDPGKPGSAPLGKAKRVRGLMISALETHPELIEKFAQGLLSSIRACGGFRPNDSNYVGLANIENLASAFKRHGILLDSEGGVSHLTLENLNSKEFTEALNNYIVRAKKGVEDAALIVGTSKDLMEAVAAHVIKELFGAYPTTANFPALLGQAFIALKLATPQEKPISGEHPRKHMERSLFELALSVNKLRNKQGTGHGRPMLADLHDDDAKVAIESIGIIAEFLLKKLKTIS